MGELAIAPEYALTGVLYFTGVLAFTSVLLFADFFFILSDTALAVVALFGQGRSRHLN